MHAKTFFAGVRQTQYDFFSFETIGRMHKNIFFSIFFVFLEVLTKTGYFNTGFVFFQNDKKQTEIKQNNVKQYTRGNHKY
jgi:hypothetical protein